MMIGACCMSEVNDGGRNGSVVVVVVLRAVVQNAVEALRPQQQTDRQTDRRTDDAAGSLEESEGRPAVHKS